MSTSNTSGNRTIWVGVMAAVASSLCCIVPLLAALAGVGSLASSFHWIGPARPYLIGVALLALGYAWWLKLRPVPADECGCETTQRKTFLQSTGFLIAITAFAIITSAFPLYASIFEQAPRTAAISEQTPVQRVVIDVKGMTCEGCEQHVSGALRKLSGVTSAEASYKQATATVTFDPATTSTQQLLAAIDSTGYTALGVKQENK